MKNIFVLVVLFSLTIFPQNVNIQELRQQALSLIAKKEYKESLVLCEKISELNPKDSVIYFYSALNYWQTKDIVNLNSAILSCLFLNYSTTFLEYVGGICVDAQIEDSILEKIDTQTFQSNWPGFFAGIAFAYCKDGHLKKGEDILDNNLGKTPYDYKFHLYLAKLMWTINNNQSKADEYLRLAISENQTYCKSYFEYASFLASTNKLEDAKDNYIKAIKCDSLYVNSYFNLAMTYGKLGEKELVKKTLQKAADLGDEDAKAFLKKIGD